MALRSFVWRTALSGISACAEGLFPENDYGVPDWRATDMVERTCEYLDALPAAQRRLLTSLFVVVELGAVVLAKRLRRFSRMSPDERAAAVRAWRRSRFLPLRVLGDAIKATTTVIYMSHPLALAHIGAYKSCERPGDALTFRVDPDALTRLSSS